jgi:ElaB/YqjD/DUF883 family membrane-anchored ribosome-binding protein
MNLVPDNVLHNLPPQTAANLEVARDKVSELERTSRKFIQENPVAAVAGALALGFVVARLVRR